MILRGTCLIAMVVILAACGGGDAPAYQMISLPSGRQVKSLGVGRINFANDSPALMLKYISDVSAAKDTAALRREAEEIWASFRQEADRAGVGAAILSATSAPTGGMISHGWTNSFVYKKDSSGTWTETGGH